MPYQTHTAFDEPRDQTARLWRYMDLPKLLSVLDKRALFFPSVATLSKDDPYAGEPTLSKLRAAESEGANALKKLRLEATVFKHLNFFNCWHMNDSESDAMWKLYMRGSDGVAIQTTVDRLMNCFAHAVDNVYMGQVQYVDHNNITLSSENISPSDYMLKRLDISILERSYSLCLPPVHSARHI